MRYQSTYGVNLPYENCAHFREMNGARMVLAGAILGYFLKGHPPGEAGSETTVLGLLDHREKVEMDLQQVVGS